MRRLAAAADQIDYWIRRHVITYCHGIHPSQKKSARDRGVGLLAIWQIGLCVKDQYSVFASPIPPHLAALVEQLRAQT
jgi:hypothetical protein